MKIYIKLPHYKHCNKCKFLKHKNIFAYLFTFSDSEFKCLLGYKGLVDVDTSSFIPSFWGYVERPKECIKKNRR